MLKRNVLYIGNYLNRPGGNPPYMISLGRYLEADGYRLTYASDRPNKILRLFHMIWTVLISGRKSDYILIDTYSTQNFFYALIVSQICRLFKFKYLPILHGGNLEHRLNANPKFCRMIFKNAHLNISPSRFMEEVFRKNGFLNITYIPNAIPVHDFSYSEPSFKTLNIFWLRSFADIYNPDMALKTLKVLKEKGVDSELIMVGPDRHNKIEQLKIFASKNELKIQFPGKLNKSEWINLARNCNIFINTSNFDNMPLSILEIMALGLPVVSTGVGGVPFLIEDGVEGLLVPENDHLAMANAVLKLCNDHGLARGISENAREKAESFDWQVVKHKWHEVLA